MLARLVIATAVALTVMPTAFAQSPYAGLQARPVKALSDQQIADLRAGRGMGLALPAELNGYPGPSHVLELADQLGLTADQQLAVRGLFEAMRAETIPIGEQLIAEERALDALFAERKATSENITALAAEIGGTQAKLRSAHLRYHLSTLAVLQPAQLQRYAELRGYGQAPAGHRHH